MTEPFKVPPEVPRYFGDKSLKPAFSWQDVWNEEHAHAFTVAKAVELDLLKAFKQSIATAIEKGQGFETWRANLKPELERLGWWGKRTVRDPTGAYKPKDVDFSAPARLQTVFWSNMRSARAAGQWERIQRSKRGLPYLVYVHTVSARPRPLHLSWVGTVLPVDDPFWSTHYPPNGWGCKCSVRQVTGRERDGLLAEDGYSDARPPALPKPYLNRRTGEISEVPDGIDPGWATNPGKARAQTLLKSIEGKLTEAGPVAARRRVEELWTSEYPEVLAAAPTRIRAPVAISEALQAEMKAGGSVVSVSNDTVARKVLKHATVTPERFALIQKILDKGALIKQTGGAVLAAATIEGKLWKAVVKRSETGFLYISTFHRGKLKDLKGVVPPEIADVEE